MKTKLYILIFNLLAIIYCVGIRQQKDVVEEFKKIKKDEKFYQGVINITKKFLEYYALHNIAKDPPQPEWNSSYFFLK